MKTRDGRKRRLFRRRQGIEGIARIDPRTKNLLLRLRPGEVAVILHDDLDVVAAEGLAERGAAAVINCHRSVTGRYPNAGPLVLEHAGIPLIDDVGEDMLERVTEGDRIRIEDGEIYAGDEVIGKGVVLAGEELQRRLEQANASIGPELERFVRNTMEFLQSERDLVLQGAGMPELRTQLARRPAVVVVRGHEYRRDLQTLRGYIKDMRPVLIAVDGAADALLEERLRPDLIIGDMDSVSTAALTCGAELVVHAYPDGTAPGLERIEGLGLDAHVLPSAGTSEDIALLLAYEKDADLIVAVGAHDNLAEFFDKGRAGMASTFVVRLKVGPKLVDVKGVNRLYRGLVRTRDLVLLVLAAVTAMATAIAVSPLRIAARNAIESLEDFFDGLF